MEKPIINSPCSCKPDSRPENDCDETVDAIADLITIHRADHVILRANRAARELLGLPDHFAEETTCHRYFHCTTTPIDECPMAKAQATNLPATMTHYNELLGRHFEVKVQPRMDVTGTCPEFIHIVRDVTERKRLEEQLLQVQRMESMGTLAVGVAHDFNNILTVISGNAALMEMKLPGEHPLRHPVSMILEAAERAAGLTTSLLTFSRNHTGPVDLVNILRSMEMFLQMVIGDDITLGIHIDEEKLVVNGVKAQLEQLILNLATNARDAMPEGGRLYIDLAATDLEVGGRLPPGGYAVLTCEDTGCGIEEKVKERIFDPFFTTKHDRGTGVGLSLVYEIVTKHLGAIEVSSSVGNGTTFRILIPLAATETRTTAAVEGLQLHGAETILLVEDNHDVCKVTSDSLEYYGYRVVATTDREKAVAQYAAHPGGIDLVLMDVIMPDIAWRQAYEAMRRINSNVKVLFMSGYSEDILSLKSFSRMQFNVIRKPALPSELARKVRAMLDAGNG